MSARDNSKRTIEDRRAPADEDVENLQALLTEKAKQAENIRRLESLKVLRCMEFLSYAYDRRITREVIYISLLGYFGHKEITRNQISRSLQHLKHDGKIEFRGPDEAPGMHKSWRMKRIMSPNEYQRSAARTLLTEPDFDIPPLQVMLIWNVTGLVGETGEVFRIITNPVNPAIFGELEKEIGDVLWYCAAICSTLGLNMGDVMPDQESTTPIVDPESTAKSLMSAVAMVAETAKKQIFHRHGIVQTEWWHWLKAILYRLVTLCNSKKISVKDVMELNIEKLKARYPDGWDAARSTDEFKKGIAR